MPLARSMSSVVGASHRLSFSVRDYPGGCSTCTVRFETSSEYEWVTEWLIPSRVTTVKCIYRSKTGNLGALGTKKPKRAGHCHSKRRWNMASWCRSKWQLASWRHDATPQLWCWDWGIATKLVVKHDCFSTMWFGHVSASGCDRRWLTIAVQAQHTYLHAYLHSSTYLHTCTHAPCIHNDTRAHTHMCIRHIYIHIPTYSYIFTFAHTHVVLHTVIE